MYVDDMEGDGINILIRTHKSHTWRNNDRGSKSWKILV